MSVANHATCAACGRRGPARIRITFPPFEWVPKTHFPGVGDGPFPAGSPSCWFHQPVPASRVPPAALTEEIEEELGKFLHWPGPAAERELGKVAVPRECPVCAAMDPFITQVMAFEQGLALIAVCSQCSHSVGLRRKEQLRARSWLPWLPLAAFRGSGAHAAFHRHAAALAPLHHLGWIAVVAAFLVTAL